MVDMKKTDEKGMALILVMIMLAVLSVIAASLMAVSTADTASSMNYRLMTLARYGAESAVHRAANYLMSDAYKAVEPGTGADPLTNYNMSGTPDPVTNLSVVTYPVSNGAPVRLSSDSATFNYPGGFGGTVGTAFRAASTGTLAGTNTITYRAVATLVSMRQISVVGGGSRIVQTWKITGTGSLSANSPAEIDVSSILERQVQPTFRYAAFAVDKGCKALWWTGNGTVNSYDSTSPLVAGAPVISNTGGNVGTNGQLWVANNSDINGTLSVPPPQLSECLPQYVGPVNAVDGIVPLPQTVAYPTPDPPSPMPGMGNEMVNVDTDFNPPTLDENGNLVGATHADVKVQAGKTLTLHAGTYNMNSLALAGGATLVIPGTGNVIINLAGQNFAANQSVLDIAGNTISTGSYDPARLQIIYAGTATVGLSGSGETSALLYAPNATVNMNAAGGHWYGAVIGDTIKDASAALHYDRSLQRKMMTLGAFMLDSFTWRKY
jgi:hypothetical protein